MNTIITGDESWIYGERPGNQIVPSSTLLWKSDKTTKHYLTQMLLAINWRYWEACKNARIHLKVQDHFLLARSIKIHPIFGKKKKNVGYFSNRVVFAVNVLVCLILRHMHKKNIQMEGHVPILLLARWVSCTKKWGKRNRCYAQTGIMMLVVC